MDQQPPFPSRRGRRAFAGVAALAAVLLATLAASVPPAAAQPAPPPPPGRAGEGALLPLAHAAARVAERYEGRLLDARVTGGRGRERAEVVYEIRWLTPSGDVLRVRLDARDGGWIEVDGAGQSAARRPVPPSR